MKLLMMIKKPNYILLLIIALVGVACADLPLILLQVTQEPTLDLNQSLNYYAKLKLANLDFEGQLGQSHSQGLTEVHFNLSHFQSHLEVEHQLSSSLTLLDLLSDSSPTWNTTKLRVNSPKFGSVNLNLTKETTSCGEHWNYTGMVFLELLDLDPIKKAWYSIELIIPKNLSNYHLYCPTIQLEHTLRTDPEVLKFHSSVKPFGSNCDDIHIEVILSSSQWANANFHLKQVFHLTPSGGEMMQTQSPLGTLIIWALWNPLVKLYHKSFTFDPTTLELPKVMISYTKHQSQFDLGLGFQLRLSPASPLITSKILSNFIHLTSSLLGTLANLFLTSLELFELTLFALTKNLIPEFSQNLFQLFPLLLFVLLIRFLRKSVILKSILKYIVKGTLVLTFFGACLQVFLPRFVVWQKFFDFY